MIYDAVPDSVLDVISSPRTKTVVGASVATILVWRIVNKVIRDYFVRKYTIIPDLRSFGRSRDEGKRIKGTAVVCGGRSVRLPVRLWKMGRLIRLCLFIASLAYGQLVSVLTTLTKSS